MRVVEIDGEILTIPDGWDGFQWHGVVYVRGEDGQFRQAKAVVENKSVFREKRA